MKLYLDESGKTGTQRYSQGWNFSNQPYFLLCGVLVDENVIENINNVIKNLHRKYGIQGEFKSTKEKVKKNQEILLTEFNQIIRDNNCKLFIEVVNKKFSIVKQIVSYCIFPYYDVSEEQYNSQEADILRRCFANYVYCKISDKLLSDFVLFFDNNSQEEKQLILLCESLMEEMGNQYITSYVAETIDSIIRHEDLGLLKRHVFPIADYYKGSSSSVVVSPHIDSFNNIINRTAHFGVSTITHDKLNDLCEALQTALNSQKELKKINSTLEFGDSKDVMLLQFVDFWAGVTRESISGIILKNENPHDTVIKIVRNDVVFVGSFEEQIKLFPQNIELQKWYQYYKEIFK